MARHIGMNLHELGLSGSGIEFLQVDGSLYCYAGTLGALVEDTADPSLTYVLRAIPPC